MSSSPYVLLDLLHHRGEKGDGETLFPNPGSGFLHFSVALQEDKKTHLEVSENQYGHRQVKIDWKQSPPLIIFTLNRAPTIEDTAFPGGGIQVWLQDDDNLRVSWEGLPSSSLNGPPGFLTFFSGETVYVWTPSSKGRYSFEICTSNYEIQDAGVCISIVYN
jgi:hypothetical protein